MARSRVRRTEIERSNYPKVETTCPVCAGRIQLILGGITGTDGEGKHHEFAATLNEYQVRHLLRELRKLRKAVSTVRTQRAQSDAENERAFLP